MCEKAKKSIKIIDRFQLEFFKEFAIPFVFR